MTPRLDTALAPFVKSLRRRLGRDQDRLYIYHNDLHREAMRRRAALPESDGAPRREDQRIEAIGREYQAKLDDLSRQYALRVTAEWVQTLELVMPVQRFAVQLRRRKAERTIELDWNPLARRLESPACDYSRSAERPRLVCDDALHLVVPDRAAPCAGCGKVLCRACHRKSCPRCEARNGGNLGYTGDPQLVPQASKQDSLTTETRGPGGDTEKKTGATHTALTGAGEFFLSIRHLPMSCRW